MFVLVTYMILLFLSADGRGCPAVLLEPLVIWINGVYMMQKESTKLNICFSISTVLKIFTTVYYFL